MSDETKRRILAALEGAYGNATDNAARARAVEKRGSYSAAEGALYREYYREESDALAALREFEPNWQPRKAFGR